jgi:hypothetical protein
MIEYKNSSTGSETPRDPVPRVVRLGVGSDSAGYQTLTALRGIRFGGDDGAKSTLLWQLKKKRF